MISLATNDLPESSAAFLWKHLASMDRQSPDFLPLLITLTAAANRPLMTTLRDDDARITLSAMDEVSYSFSVKAITYVVPFAQLFRDGKIPSEHNRDALSAMRMLAYSSGQILPPPRYQVNQHSLRVGANVIADGAFSDIRKGTLGGKTVAIRTLRVGPWADCSKAQKVRVASNQFSGGH